MKIMCLDIGHTTGYAIFDLSNKEFNSIGEIYLVSFGEINPVAFDLLEDLWKEHNIDHIAYELPFATTFSSFAGVTAKVSETFQNRLNNALQFNRGMKILVKPGVWKNHNFSQAETVKIRQCSSKHIRDAVSIAFYIDYYWSEIYTDKNT